MRSGSAPHRSWTDGTGAVSVGDVIHKVRLRLHSKEERKEEERVKKGRSKVKLYCGTVVNHSFWRRMGDSHELAQEVKSSQMDKCVSTSQGCVFGLCEDSGVNLSLH